MTNLQILAIHKIPNYLQQLFVPIYAHLVCFKFFLR